MANEKMEKLENLKETKKDNMLNEEELHEVDGGFSDFWYGDGYGGWANSSRFLNVLLGGAVCDRYGNDRANWNKKEITAAWTKVGVEVHGDAPWDIRMVYKINGKKVSAQQAFEHAMNVTGKHLKPEDWCW